MAAWDRLPAIVKLLDTAREAGIPRVLTCGSAPDAVFVGGAVKLSSEVVDSAALRDRLQTDQLMGQP